MQTFHNRTKAGTPNTQRPCARVHAGIRHRLFLFLSLSPGTVINFIFSEMVSLIRLLIIEVVLGKIPSIYFPLIVTENYRQRRQVQ